MNGRGQDRSHSGDFVTIEVLTHHADDDAERMVKGDPGAESVFYWDRQKKGVDRRGAGPMNPTLFGRGAGEGLGVHVCTGPVAVKGAAPGDILEVRITEPKEREVITIYEIDTSGERDWAKALYNCRWTPQTDPFGVVHKIIDYPGVPVDTRRCRGSTGS